MPLQPVLNTDKSKQIFVCDAVLDIKAIKKPSLNYITIYIKPYYNLF